MQKKENNNVYVGKDGNLFEKKTKIDMKNVDKSIDIINKLAVSTGKNIYFTLIPTSTFANKEEMPRYAPSYDQSNIIDYVSLKTTNATFIDVRDIILKESKNYIYFKTDHHMTSYGSFLIYNQILKNMGKKEHSLSDYRVKVVSEEFLGTLDSKAQVLNQEKDIIEKYEIGSIKSIILDGERGDSIYSEEYLNKKDKYSYFLDANHAIIKIVTNSSNNEKLLVIKDSYANNMIQCMLDDFSEIHIIDPRYYRAKITDYVTHNEIDTLLFIYNTSNFIDELGIRNIT